MKKRIFSILLISFMLLLGMSAVALADDGVLYVNGVDILSAEDNTVVCGSGTAVYDATSNTLTLNNAEITDFKSFEGFSAGIYAKNLDGLKINPVGENEIITNEVDGDLRGIYFEQGETLTICSDDPFSRKLEVIANTGIKTDGRLNIEEADVDVYGRNGNAIFATELNITDSYVKVDSFNGHTIRLDIENLEDYSEDYSYNVNIAESTLTLGKQREETKQIYGFSNGGIPSTTTGKIVPADGNKLIKATGLDNGTGLEVDLIAEYGSAAAVLDNINNIAFDNVTLEIAKQELYVNGVDILSAENNTVQCGSGTAVYDATTNTLTLTNATITKFIRDIDHSPSIYAKDLVDLTIKVVGVNTIELESTSSNTVLINTETNANQRTSIKIIGDGANSSKLELKGNIKIGIRVFGDALTIEKVNLDISGAQAVTAIQSSELTITDSMVRVSNDGSGDCMYMYRASGGGSQNITIANSTLDLTSRGEDSEAISFAANNGEIIIDSGNALVTAKSGSTDLLDGKTASEVLSDIKSSDYKNLMLQVVKAKDLYVNGVNITTAKDNTVQCGSGTAVYDAATNTITLNNATITEYHNENGWWRYIDATDEDNLTIKLVGKNTIKGSSKNSDSQYGIQFREGETLTICGDSAESSKLSIEEIGLVGISSCILNIEKEDVSVSNTADPIFTCELNITDSIVKVNGYSGGIWFMGDIENYSNNVNIASSTLVFDGGRIASDDETIAAGRGKIVPVSGNKLVRASGLNKNTGLRVDLIDEYGSAEAVLENINAIGYSDITLEIAEAYPVSYVPGADGVGDSLSVDKIHGEDLELAGQLFTRSGYKQVGWATTDSGEKVYELNGTYTADEEITLYPAWQKKSSYVAAVPSYTLSFATNGGSKINAISASSDETINLSSYKTTKDGYSFVCLYSDKDLKNKVTSIMLSSDMTVYAAWKEVVEEEKTPSVEKSFDFKDVQSNDWFYNDVKWAFEQGLMMGTTADNFSPNTFTTRGMIVTILWRMEGSPVVNYALPFSDVADGMWYSEAIRWAASERIVSGYSATIFAPDDEITREQLAAMLYNYAKYKNIDVSVGENTNILSYDDAFDISDYAYEALQWAVGDGIMGGMTESTIAPQNLATRAQVAAMLHRFLS